MDKVDNDIQIQGLKYFKRLMPLLYGLEKVGYERDKAGGRIRAVAEPVQRECVTATC